MYSNWRIGHIWEIVGKGRSWYGNVVYMGLVCMVLVSMGLVGKGWAILYFVNVKNIILDCLL